MDFGKKEDLVSTARRMKECWGKREARLMKEQAGREFAVLIPLTDAGGETALLFEVRSGSLKSQPGEICFPGGALETGETPLQAALREAGEELLIREEDIEVLAPMDILLTPVGITIYPFLARISGYENTFSKDEVEQVFEVPLDWFLKNEPEKHRTRILTVPDDDFPYELVPDGRNYTWREGVYNVLFYRWGKRVIWGMTAKILRAFVELYGKELHQEESR